MEPRDRSDALGRGLVVGRDTQEGTQTASIRVPSTWASGALSFGASIQAGRAAVREDL